MALPDIHLSVYLLCTRVRGPGMDDYKKLARKMKYTQGKIGLPLILSINKSGNIKWYVDVAFAVHKGTRNHTSGLINIGKIGDYVKSNQQNLITKSSTEAEIIIADVRP